MQISGGSTLKLLAGSAVGLLLLMTSGCGGGGSGLSATESSVAGDRLAVKTTCNGLVCTTTPSSLWPPNHNLIPISISVTKDGTAAVITGSTVYADEDDEEQTGDGNFSPDAKVTCAVTNASIAGGCPKECTLRLRSERKGNSNGRVYLLIVTTNLGTVACTVVVPHSQSQAAIASVNAQAQAAASFYNTNGAIPSGFVLVGDGAIIGPKQ